MIMLVFHIIQLSLNAIKKSISLCKKRDLGVQIMVPPLSRVLNYCEISRKTIKKSIFRQGRVNLFGQKSSWVNKKYPHWRRQEDRAKKGIGHSAKPLLPCHF